MSTLAGGLRRLVQLLLFYLMLLWLGAMLLIGNVVCLPLALVPRARREPFLQGLISLTFRVFLAGCAACGLMRLDLRDLDRVNGQRGLLLVANHPSMIDVFLVISRVRQAICLMKASLTANVFLASGARLAGYISNRQADQMIRRAAQTVSQGGVLLIFPEGTRTTRQPVNPLGAGAALIAKRAHAPLQTIVLETNSPYLAKGWPIWRPPQFPLLYRARLGAVLSPSDSVSDTVARLQQYFEHELTLSIDPGLEG